MDVLAVAARAVAAYVFLLALVRASGKRTVSQATPFDFVMALVLGDLVDDVLWGEVGPARFAVAAGTLVVVQMAVAVGQARSVWFHRWAAGDPVALLRAGRPVKGALRGQRIRDNELEAHLRVHGVERHRWRDVATAWLENSGTVSLEKAGHAQEVQRRDLAEDDR